MVPLIGPYVLFCLPWWLMLATVAEMYRRAEKVTN